MPFVVAGSGSIQQPGRLAGLPLIRTLRSRSFRLAIAVTLLAIGTLFNGLFLVRQISDPQNGEFAIDFTDYRTASLRMLEGRSPYAAEMLAGPVAAQGTDRYRYPPPFAQLLTPLAVLPLSIGSSVWLAVQLTTLVGAVWIGASAAGAPASLGRFIWTGLALVYFLPVFDALLKGNVNGILALGFAVLLYPRGQETPRSTFKGREIAAGLSIGGGVVLKLTPLAILPAALVARRREAVVACAAIAALTVPSVMLAPYAWSDYARVLPNLLSGSADYANNLAPAAVAYNLGLASPIPEVIRAATVVIAIGLVGLAIFLARRPHGWPAAVTAAVAAALFLPAAMWYQYLTLLLPIAAFAWVRATSAGRLGLAVSGAGITIGLAFLPLAAASAVVMTALTGAILWPRAEPSR